MSREQGQSYFTTSFLTPGSVLALNSLSLHEAAINRLLMFYLKRSKGAWSLNWLSWTGVFKSPVYYGITWSALSCSCVTSLNTWKRHTSEILLSSLSSIDSWDIIISIITMIVMMMMILVANNDHLQLGMHCPGAVISQRTQSSS